MKTIYTTLPGTIHASRFDAARALAFDIAASGSEFIEPELVAWVDRSSARASPEVEGCYGPNGWHDYGLSHDGRLEVEVGDAMSFIFTESTRFDSYAHLGPGPFVNLRDAQGNLMICRVGGKDCVPLDEWTSKLT